MAEIGFFTEDIEFKCKRKTALRKWIIYVFRSEGFKAKTINIIFCSDEYLLDINTKYLKHNTLTDVITFSYNENDGNIEGDIFISIDRVRENAGIFKEPFDKELNRVIVHGILHLVGYNDKTKLDKELMVQKENFYLEMYSGI